MGTRVSSRVMLQRGETGINGSYNVAGQPSDCQIPAVASSAQQTPECMVTVVCTGPLFSALSPSGDKVEAGG